MIRVLAFGFAWAGICAGVFGSVTGLHSIKQIVGGTTLDFENAIQRSYANSGLLPHGLSDIGANPSPITQFVPWVAGNSDAPMAGNALFSIGGISTSTGWQAVGLSLGSTLAGAGNNQTFTFTAFDKAGNALYTDRHSFVLSTNAEAEYNGAIFFEGVASTTPIYSFQVTSSNPNYAGDNLTYVSAPEPAAGCMLGLLLLFPGRRRRVNQCCRSQLRLAFAPSPVCGCGFSSS